MLILLVRDPKARVHETNAIVNVVSGTFADLPFLDKLESKKMIEQID